jgi:RNA-binding protein
VPLSPTQRKTLRRLGHDRKAIVLLGAGGLSAGALAEIERALADHELIKVRVRAGDRGDRDDVIAAIGARTGAELVQRIGHVALLYRRNPEKPRIRLDEEDAAGSGRDADQSP